MGLTGRVEGTLRRQIAAQVNHRFRDFALTVRDISSLGPALYLGPNHGRKVRSIDIFIREAGNCGADEELRALDWGRAA